MYNYTMEFKAAFLKNINTVCLPGSRSCSLSCSYCYAGYNKFTLSPDQGISRELIDKSLDFLVNKLRPIHQPMLVIGFGGDPIEAFAHVLYAHSKVKSEPQYAKVKVVMSTTHGQNLSEEHIKFLEENGGYVSFSIDGTRENHNKNRTSRNPNVDSYKKVLAAYEKAKDRLLCSANGTVTPDGNLSEDLLHLYDLGFRIITMIPVRPAESENLSLNVEFTRALQKQYSSLISSLKLLDDRKLSGVLTSVTSEDYFNKFFNRIVMGKSFHRKCGAAFNFVYVSSEGDITPCSSFRTYQGAQYVIGHLDRGFDIEKVAPVFSFSTKKQEPCKSCEVESVCSGFCFFNSFQSHGKIDQPFLEECRLAKYVIAELKNFYEYLKESRPQVLENYIIHSQKMEQMDSDYFKEASV